MPTEKSARQKIKFQQLLISSTRNSLPTSSCNQDLVNTANVANIIDKNMIPDENQAKAKGKSASSHATAISLMPSLEKDEKGRLSGPQIIEKTNTADIAGASANILSNDADIASLVMDTATNTAGIAGNNVELATLKVIQDETTEANLLKTMSHINSEFFQLFVEPDDKHCYVPTAYHKDWPRILTWSQMMTAYERSYNMAQRNYLSEVTNNKGYSKDCGFPHPSVFTSTKTSTASSSIGSTVLL